MHTANARSANATLTKAFNKYEVSDQDAKSIIRAVYLLTAKKVEDANEQEAAPPMTPERAAEVQTMYARAEAAAAIVTAAVQYISADDLFHPSYHTLHHAVVRYNALPR